MKLGDILRRKGSEVVTVSPESSVLEAMRTLVEHGIGSVVVKRADEVIGILTERDILQLGARDPRLLSSTEVGEAMSSELVVGLEADAIDYAMAVMTENRIRHLPIFRGERLAGIVSIGDLVNACRRQAEVENRYLREYVQGRTY